MTNKQRKAETAAATEQLAPQRGPTRRQIQGTIRTLEANAADAERAGRPVSAARTRAKIAELQERL